MLSHASFKSDKTDSIRGAEIQVSNLQLGFNAHSIKIGDSFTHSITRRNTKFATSIIRDRPMNLQPVAGDKIDKLAKLRLPLSPVKEKGAKLRLNTSKPEILQSSLMALAALSAFGAASYGMLRNQWESSNLVQDINEQSRQLKHKEAVRVQRERRERRRPENKRLFQMALMGFSLALAVLVLMYMGWLYFMLAVTIALTLFVCALS